MRDIRFSYIQQHNETGVFTESCLELEYIEAINTGLQYKGYTIIARRQFTGLYDKNGKPICEGDVVQTPHFKGGNTTHYMHHIVEWSDRFSGWFARSTVAKHDNDGCVQLWVYAKNTGGGEIIGNIYEHPHLLEAQ